MWERQSQQPGAQRGAEGLLGRMQAKGIVGNYTGLQRASNALIQRDIFIKKQRCRTAAKREREREEPQPVFFLSSSPGLDLAETFFLRFCVAFASWYLFEQHYPCTRKDDGERGGRGVAGRPGV